MNNSLTKFEEKVINSIDITFEYPYQVEAIVDKFNECILRYYYDYIYSFLLKKKLEKHNHIFFSDENFINYVKNNDLNGFMIFPDKLLDKVDKDYIYFFMNKVICFVNKIGYNNDNFEAFINKSKRKSMGNFVRYKTCVSAVKNLELMEKDGLTDLVLETEQKININNFGKIEQLLDFCDRLNNYYINSTKNNELKIMKLEKVRNEIDEN